MSLTSALGGAPGYWVLSWGWLALTLVFLFWVALALISIWWRSAEKCAALLQSLLIWGFLFVVVVSLGFNVSRLRYRQLDAGQRAAITLGLERTDKVATVVQVYWMARSADNETIGFAHDISRALQHPSWSVDPATSYLGQPEITGAPGLWISHADTPKSEEYAEHLKQAIQTAGLEVGRRVGPRHTDAYMTLWVGENPLFPFKRPTPPLISVRDVTTDPVGDSVER